jgi:hypothetical protein
MVFLAEYTLPVMGSRSPDADMVIVDERYIWEGNVTFNPIQYN